MEKREIIDSAPRVEAYPAKLPNNMVVLVQPVNAGGREQVVSGDLSFEGVTDAVQGIAQSIVAIWEKVKPDRATVEFGVQIALQSGKLTAMFVQGSGSADLRITMEWGKKAEE